MFLSKHNRNSVGVSRPSTALQTKGFTLLELLLYIGISSTLLLGLTTMFGLVTTAQIKNQVLGELATQSAQIEWMMMRDIRNATSITTPASQGVSSSILVLSTSGSVVTYDISSNVLRRAINSGTPEAMHNLRISTNSFTVTNLTPSGNPGTLGIVIDLSHTNPESRNEYNAQTTLQFSSSLRF